MAKEQVSTEMNADKQMKLSGLIADSNNVDPISGNDIPLGATAQGVRDDQTAALSAGEFIIPEHAVRYHGIDFYMNSIQTAETGLEQMDDMGMTGRPDTAVLDKDTPLPTTESTEQSLESPEQYVARTDALLREPVSVKRFAVGGLYQTALPTPTQTVMPSPVATAAATPVQPTPAYVPPAQVQPPVQAPIRDKTYPDWQGPAAGLPGGYGIEAYINPTTGERFYLTTVGGKVQQPIPPGFIKMSEYMQQQATPPATPPTPPIPIDEEPEDRDKDVDETSLRGARSKQIIEEIQQQETISGPRSTYAQQAQDLATNYIENYDPTAQGAITGYGGKVLIGKNIAVPSGVVRVDGEGHVYKINQDGTEDRLSNSDGKAILTALSIQSNNDPTQNGTGGVEGLTINPTSGVLNVGATGGSDPSSAANLYSIPNTDSFINNLGIGVNILNGVARQFTIDEKTWNSLPPELQVWALGPNNENVIKVDDGPLQQISKFSPILALASLIFTPLNKGINPSFNMINVNTWRQNNPNIPPDPSNLIKKPKPWTSDERHKIPPQVGPRLGDDTSNGPDDGTSNGYLDPKPPSDDPYDISSIDPEPEPDPDPEPDPKPVYKDDTKTLGVPDIQDVYGAPTITQPTPTPTPTQPPSTPTPRFDPDQEVPYAAGGLVKKRPRKRKKTGKGLAKRK